jgi:hypothetical protein
MSEFVTSERVAAAGCATTWRRINIGLSHMSYITHLNLYKYIEREKRGLYSSIESLCQKPAPSVSSVPNLINTGVPLSRVQRLSHVRRVFRDNFKFPRSRRAGGANRCGTRKARHRRAAQRTSISARRAWSGVA